MTFRTTSLLSALSVLALTACSSGQVATETAEAPHTHDHSDYAKPGAAVEISTDYDGSTNPSDVEGFTLTVTEDYAAGTLNVLLAADEALTMYSATEASFDMSSPAPHTMNVDLSSADPGIYYLNVFMTVELPGGESIPAVRAITIPVGDLDELSFEPESAMTTTPLGENIIEMEAEETITTND